MNFAFVLVCLINFVCLPTSASHGVLQGLSTIHSASRVFSRSRGHSSIHTHKLLRDHCMAMHWWQPLFFGHLLSRCPNKDSWLVCLFVWGQSSQPNLRASGITNLCDAVRGSWCRRIPYYQSMLFSVARGTSNRTLPRAALSRPTVTLSDGTAADTVTATRSSVQ